ncbi:MAG: FlgO family outer membrane protein [Halarcobacter ebronensis]|uniref:FlgO family outer membrane protein n=1 Tax=Halarcobacter ebronensis TaxID=1462615 RepID=UPI003C747C4C
MTKAFLQISKLIILVSIPLFLFTSCSLKKMTGSEDLPSFMENMAKKAPSNHKKITGSNDFSSLINNLILKTSTRLDRYLLDDDVVLVSDFVNIDKLENRSKLGFLLSEHLKDALLNKNIIVRQVELSENFSYGQNGLNLLTRKQRDISNKSVDGKFAVVGTYTITTETLIVFMKLIDVTNGNILASANSSTSVDDEILELEGIKKERELSLPPRVIL